MQIHILSFEGPDEYSRAGGIASRVTGLAEALAVSGFDTHLWFVGDPDLAGHETRNGVNLHRWCQWISSYHPRGVYDGEEGKRSDLARSLPLFLLRQELLPHFRATARRAVVLAEEWHTADAVLHLDELLRRTRLGRHVDIYWNANNTFGFHRVDWRRLAQTAVITTVSRYMRYQMWNLGVDPLVIPNGLSPDALQQPDRETFIEFRNRFKDRTTLGKVARWDPDKRWLLAIDTIGELKRHGKRPLLIARGGVEAHRNDVLAKAAGDGLRVAERGNGKRGARGLLESLGGLDDFDVVCLQSPLDVRARRLLFRGADAILANSGHEPFGLVGLETMAVGGLACTGGTGEDYVVPGWNALVLQSTSPGEFLDLFQRLQRNPPEIRAIRRNARYTANQHSWRSIIHRNLLPRLGLDTDDGPSENREVLRFRRSHEVAECKTIGASSALPKGSGHLLNSLSSSIHP